MSSIFINRLKPAILRLYRPHRNPIRTFLSPAYYCNESWENRLNSPILQKINLDTLYFELDQRYQKTRQLSAVDVDIFANSATNDVFVDELLDLVHKLRLTSQTGQALDSMTHAIIRFLLQHGKIEELLLALDDRLNYGLFLDDYTANLLLDYFWKHKNFVGGALVAGQIMLQEDFKHPITIALSLLHCYNYLLTPGEWVQAKLPEEPEEEVKIRVRYLRNPYNDDHFDLREPQRIVGKTLALATQNRQDSLHKSLNLLGWALFGDNEALQNTIKDCIANNIQLYKEIIDLIPEDKRDENLQNLTKLSGNISELLSQQVHEAVQKYSQEDIDKQLKIFKEWEQKRIGALDEQKRQLQIAKRLNEIEDIKKSLKHKEQKLWFFENEENIELEIEEKQQLVQEKKIKTIKDDSEYIPPEITAQRQN